MGRPLFLYLVTHDLRAPAKFSGEGCRDNSVAFFVFCHRRLLLYAGLCETDLHQPN
jgi:hypothetical protein